MTKVVTVTVKINGEAMTVPHGTTAAIAAFAHQGFTRGSTNGEPRAPLCGMGICFECRLTIDGQPHRRACLIPCRDGMEIEVDA